MYSHRERRILPPANTSHRGNPLRKREFFPQAILLQALLHKPEIEQGVIRLDFGSMRTKLPDVTSIFVGTINSKSFLDKRKRIQIHRISLFRVLGRFYKNGTIGLLRRKKITVKGMC